MKYMRCKCGKAESWNSGMPSKDCQGCRECGTTFSSGPDGHKPIVPHEPQKQFDQNTGEFSHFICRRCYARCTANGEPIS